MLISLSLPSAESASDLFCRILISLMCSRVAIWYLICPLNISLILVMRLFLCSCSVSLNWVYLNLLSTLHCMRVPPS